MIYDAIVVGSGPGGASAAYELSRHGLNTLVLEKAKHPRPKACGGGLSAKIEMLLGDSFHHLVERTIYGLTLSFRGEERFTAGSSRPIAHLVQRDLFDEWMCERAGTAGAVIKEDEPVVVAMESADAVAVETPKATYCGRVLIGADGAQSVVARSLRMVPNHLVGLAIAGEAAAPPMLTDSLNGSIEIEIGRVPYGYGWVFPKRACVSFGVAMLRETGQEPRRYYRDFVAHNELLRQLPGHKSYGAIIPGFGGGKSSLVSRRTILVGDAAGLVDPFLGEGIYYAVRSGQIAAEVVAEALFREKANLARPKDALGSYDKRIAQEFHNDFQHALLIGRMVSLHPRWCFEFFRHSPEGLEPCFRVLRGEESYSALWLQIAKHVVARRWLAEKPISEVKQPSSPRPFHSGREHRLRVAQTVLSSQDGDEG